MPFVPTGFPALDQMLDGGGECMGFPRGSLTLLGGAPGSGKSQIMRKCCDRAHKKGLRVVYITSEEEFRSEYPVWEMASLDEVARLVAHLLHPGKKEKTDLLVLDSITHMVPESRGTMVIAESARRWGRLFSTGFEESAVVGTFQPRRESTRPSAEMGHQASILLSVSNRDSSYRVDLVKSRVSASGVSCEIRPIDMEDFDRSKILTRYQRILLRGRD